MLMAFFSWWYGAGWLRQGAEISERYASLLDMFSVSLLLRTLFSPFRQLSAGSVSGPLGVQLQAFFDKTISRFIGAMVRTMTIVAGSIIIVLYTLFAGVQLIMWPLLPLAPVFGAVAWLSGWMPWK